MGKHRFTVEQEVQIGDCICPPPLAFCTKDNSYTIKDGEKEIGTMKEQTNCCCKTCCVPAFRTSTN